MMNLHTHIDVTIQLPEPVSMELDIRIPTQQPVDQLVNNLLKTLKYPYSLKDSFVIEIPNKRLVLADDDSLLDYPVVDGDYIKITRKSS